MDLSVTSLDLQQASTENDHRQCPFPTLITEEFVDSLGANVVATSDINECIQNEYPVSSHDGFSVFEGESCDWNKQKQPVKEVFHIPRTKPRFHCDAVLCPDSVLLYCPLEENNLKHDGIKVECRESSGNEKKEHLYKILVIGELGTGKTSIIKRYVHQFFSQHYRATIGVDFALKVISWDADTLIRLQLWDIAGQERFGNMTRVYYKEAVGAFVVFDVTRVPTFEAVVKWKNDLDSKVQLSDGSHIPCVLLANKCDQTKEGLVNNSEQMEEFCKEKGFLGWFETSAKENINIDEAARFLVSQILKNDQSMNSGEEGDKDKIMLDKDSHQEASPKKSCCR